jgi:hypothetical protein
MVSTPRPLGIALLAVLHVIQAFIFFLGGIAMIALGAFIRRRLVGILHLLHGVAYLIGVVLIVLALLYLGLAWGLWTGKGWAWVLSLIIAVLGIIVSLVSLVGGGLGAFVVLVLDGIIVFYLFTPNVRAFFGEQKPAATPLPGTEPPQSTTQPSGAARYCPNCGAPVQPNERFCMHCGKSLS